MSLSISAADAALSASTSYWFSWSAAITVAMTCTSLRNPSGKFGRNGRSIKRQTRMACSLARPSRRKNEPGILPAAYMRSSTSTVRGKNEAFSRACFAPVAVTSTWVRPIDAITAPPASLAIRPASSVKSLSSAPCIDVETLFASVVILFSCMTAAPLYFFRAVSRRDMFSVERGGRPLVKG